MANNIQKLYEIAGVYLCNMPDIDCSKECNKCEDYNPFTAEKQLELIKWLVKRCIYFEILEMNDESYGLEFKYAIEDEYNKKGRYACVINKDFACALAESVITMWQDLTDEQKQEIKEIL